MVCVVIKFIKFRKRKKNHVGWCWMKFVPEQNFIQHVSTQEYEFPLLDLFGGVFHPTFINFRWFQTFAHSNCNSNFLMCFQILNFVSITNIYCGFRKAKDHVLQQRRTGCTRYDRESLRKPSERKGYCKKGQRKEGIGGEHCKKDQIKKREGLGGWGNISADRYVRRKTLFVGRFWQSVYKTGRQRNSLYGDSKFFGYKHRIHQSKN